MPEIVMPRLSDSMEEGTILQWLVADGADVAEGQEIVEIESDKATVAYAAEDAGTLRIVAQEGDTLPIGTVIAMVGNGAAPAAPPDGPALGAAGAAPADEPALAGTPAPNGAGGASPPSSAAGPTAGTAPAAPAARVKASPVARRLAREEGLDLHEVAATGPAGRIVKADVLAALDARAAPAPAAPPPAAAAPAPGAAVQHRKPTRIERRVAERMVASRTEIPDFAVSIDVDVTAAVAFRQELREVVDPARRLPTMNDLVVKAVALALREHPRVNSAWTDEGIAEYTDINVGVAVATDAGGLVVPVIREADGLPLGRLADEAYALVTRARTGAATPADFAGATFTVSNLGMFGIAHFTAIITPGQGAILAVGGARTDGALTVTLSSDHRVIYGAHAAAFLARFRTLLEHPASLAL